MCMCNFSSEANDKIYVASGKIFMLSFILLLVEQVIPMLPFYPRNYNWNPKTATCILPMVPICYRPSLPVWLQRVVLPDCGYGPQLYSTRPHSLQSPAQGGSLPPQGTPTKELCVGEHETLKQNWCQVGHISHALYTSWHQWLHGTYDYICFTLKWLLVSSA